MSYPDQAPARRPAVVTAATVVLVLMAVGALAYAVTGLLIVGGTVREFRAAAASTSAGPAEIDAVVLLLWLVAALSAGLSVAVAPLLGGLALGLRRGRPGARVATWVVCGVGLLCGCCGVGALTAERAVPLRLGADARTTAELYALIPDAHPGWWLPLNAGVSVAQLLGYLVVAVLLALPAAGAWFRRPVAVTPPPHSPPTPGAPPPPAPW
ncbi:hypothetical protein GA0070616_2725 [Micromonospora nigra]|uniref:Uncharacterized protein n=1 Tax=Micromonospora nigra TaxID=145857 RepID=A0A1C6S1T5_9ACTN|nr:hypothetical protein [Micromonospora nigra]SCL23436.1 hypothetical protein GA0070616_2725 [Micromonospora nigra]